MMRVSPQTALIVLEGELGALTRAASSAYTLLDMVTDCRRALFQHATGSRNKFKYPRFRTAP
jgi:hypothetical protein